MRCVTCALFAAALLLTGCVSAGKMIDDDVAASIPRGANVVELRSDLSPGDLYNDLYEHLARSGYEIMQSDDGRGTLSTAPRDIGEDTRLAIRVFVEEDEAGSRASMRGTWGVSGTFGAGFSAALGASVNDGAADPAVWKGSGRPALAFGRMAEVASRLPCSVSYRVE